MTPGLWDMTITGVEGGVSSKKQTPYLEFSFIETDGESVHKDKFYLTPGALPRLKHLLLNAGINENTLSGTISAEQLFTISVGKSFHGKLSGREFLNKENEVKVAAEFGYAGFAEPTGTNSLKFNPNKDITKLSTNPENTSNDVATDSGALEMPSTVATDTEQTNDLPF